MVDKDIVAREFKQWLEILGPRDLMVYSDSSKPARHPERPCRGPCDPFGGGPTPLPPPPNWESAAAELESGLDDSAEAGFGGSSEVCFGYVVL